MLNDHVASDWQYRSFGYRLSILRRKTLLTIAVAANGSAASASKRMMDFMSTVLKLADTVPTDGEEPTSFRDPDDEDLIRAARLVGAAFVISENTRDFPAADASGRHMFGEIEFLQGRKFIDAYLLPLAEPR